jgi:glycosyltransferase involved in cell wall biosynthesis
VIRVVHVLTRTNIGGPSVIVASLLADDRNADIVQSVVRGVPREDEGDYFAESPLLAHITTIDELGKRVRPWDDIRAFVSLVRFFRRTKPDVVHTHMAKAGFVGRLAAWCARVPIRVHTFHGHLLTGYFSANVTRLIVFAERALRLLTTHAVVVGHAVRRDLITSRIVSADHSTVINPGIGVLEPVDPMVARRALGLPAAGVIVMYVGRFAAIKRPDRFVALAHSMVADADVHFVMVGDGPLLAETQAIAGPNVTFLGWQRDLATLISAADVVVMCSDNEGVPLFLLEAAMVGRPAVSTDVGSVRDVLEDGVTGLVVDNGDAMTLSNAVRRLAHDAHLRAQLGATARNRAQNSFTADVGVDAHAALYRSLIAARGARAGRSARSPR